MRPATTAATADDCGATSAPAAFHSDIIQFHILNKLNGSTLAAVGCASTQLLALSNDVRLWREICNSTWPSTAHPAVSAAISAFPGGHRGFYSDAFPASRCDHFTPPPDTCHPATSELISAIDIFYDGRPIYSKVLTTETLSGVFLSSPFRLDLFHLDETVAAPLKYDGDGGDSMARSAERLRVSWILIDSARGRAVEVASARAIDARWQYPSEEMQLRYATVVGGCSGGETVQMYVQLTCGGKHGGDLEVREVAFQIEDTEWRTLTGLEALGVVDAAMGGRRLRPDDGREKDTYQNFVSKSLVFRKTEPGRERRSDVAFKVAGVCVFTAIWAFFLSS